MTEKEKAAAGMMYDGNYEPVMAQERARCKDVCFRFNSTDPSQRELRAEMLKKLFGNTGEHLLVESQFWCDTGTISRSVRIFMPITVWSYSTPQR